MKRMTIVGFGRFGQLLAGIACDEFEVGIVEADTKKQALARKQDYTVQKPKDLKDADIIVLAVPISALEGVIQKIAQFVGKKQVVVDVCSVKVFPVALMNKYLPDAQTLATHPLFGPDSTKAGLKGLKVAFCPLGIDAKNLASLKKFWESKGVEVIETTPEQHDRDMIYSLAFTHTIARIIGGMDMPDINLTTKNYEAIKQVAGLSMKDTEQLFHDMLYYNPYLIPMEKRLKQAVKETLATVHAAVGEQNKARKS